MKESHGCTTFKIRSTVMVPQVQNSQDRKPEQKEIGSSVYDWALHKITPTSDNFEADVNTVNM